MRRVLYVCVHNAARSQMAQAFLNHLAKERGLNVEAVSAGTAPTKALNSAALQVMDDAGVSMAGQMPKQLTQELADSAYRIVTMGCGVDEDACPARILVSEDWGIDDPAGQPIERVREIRDEVRRKVEELIERL